MTDYIAKLRQFFIVDKGQRDYWQQPVDPEFLAREFAKQELDDITRSALRLTWMLENEKPVVFKDERIAIFRTIPTIPELFTEIEWTEIRSSHKIHEQGKVCNINPS